jgi:Glycosyltransferase family 87
VRGLARDAYRGLVLPPRTFTLSPAGRRWLHVGLFVLAVAGALAGIYVLWLHLTTDPLNDAQAYYWAGGRLNAGLPLYPPDQSVATPLGYPYPPLLAILFRPLALLPFEAAAAIWEVVVIASFVLTVWWIGPRRRETWLALGILALPIAWCLVIGQAQVLLTLFTAIGAPWSIALATNIKLFPAAIALWWIGRRDWRNLGLFVATIAGLALLQLVLAPQASLDYFTAISLKQVGAIRNISPYAISPLLWGALVIAGVAVVLRLAPTRWGWPAAVVLSVVGTPRLLVYMFMTFIAALGARDGRSQRRRDEV